jgi:hypothetical protein
MPPRRRAVHPVALEIVVAAVERLADAGYLFEVPGKGILDDVLRSTSARRGEILQFLGPFAGDVHFHSASVRPQDRRARSQLLGGMDTKTGTAVLVLTDKRSLFSDRTPPRVHPRQS